MPVTLSSPEGMLPNAPYHHVAVATGTRQVHVAGQVAHMPDGSPVPTDLAGQVSQALRNAARGLDGAGTSFRDVVRMTFYVTDWRPEKIEALMAGVQAVAAEIDLPDPMPPASLIGVEMLYEPGVLVEIEVTAIDDRE
ncbi:RidA family protein [Rhodococcus sp. NPDC047139]|uniref:RidA family protein n=1 Tax=Rhodococcus sp. NPDC047139 TaxID=3155141 RepID=UPI0033C3C99E